MGQANKPGLSGQDTPKLDMQQEGVCLVLLVLPPT